MLTKEQLIFLKSKTSYIWWKTSEETMRRHIDLILQIMNLGVTEDVGKLEKIFSKDELSDLVVFDFFSSNNISQEELEIALPFLKSAKLIQQKEN